MLDMNSALIRTIIDTRHELLMLDQRRHRLAGEARTARGPRRRRILGRTGR